MTTASSSVLGKRFERLTPSPNSAFSPFPNEKRQKTIGEMARAAIAQPRQSKWIVVLGRNHWERIFTYLRDPNHMSLEHSEFLPLAGTCHKLRTWVANMATQSINQSLKRYRDLFVQIQRDFNSKSPVYAQATAARTLVFDLLQEHGISSFPNRKDQLLLKEGLLHNEGLLIRPILKDITNVSHIGMLIQENRHFPFRLLSSKEVSVFHERMMQVWKVGKWADAQAQWESFAAKKMEPRELTQLELVLDLAGHRYDFSPENLAQIVSILKKNPKALQCMVNAGIHAKVDAKGHTFFHYLAVADMPVALEEIACSSWKKNLFLRSQQGFNIVSDAVYSGALGTIFWSLKHKDPEIQALSLDLYPDSYPEFSVAHLAAEYGQLKVLDALAKDPEKRVHGLLLQKDSAGKTIWDHAASKNALNREEVLAWIRQTELVKHLAPANRDSR